ncbi:glycoside hydrolase family 32 protein [Intestinibacillus sp. Marseille-P6563]|uniref:glycoside hydrolase family 32 protein n=1 Tax=Intestinibacillus sp. Marseille-P6563 TaxID=2364792 RepID=UPI000F0624B2|nr:glycoside hydrolase family 32 protein [Intestinibacillus sp. Marseille-P6563]
MSNALQRDLERLVVRVEREDGPRAAADPYRPRFHLMPPVGWMNDPNGLCRFGEWYHVFYQYGPFDPTGGVKHWGHYRSRDLLHWEQLPPMLYPDQPWDIHGVYSGSALVEDGTMYLYYTGNVKYAGDYDYITAGRGHNTALAVSHDGVTVASNELLLENKDYPENVTCHVRDPKVWAQDGKYYMVLGARTKEDRGQLLVYESANKRNWKHINTLTTPEVFGYMWECPDLFCLDGQWFLMCSPQGVTRQGNKYQNVYSCGYFPLHGDFRGAYTLGEYQELDCGFDFYAPQTFVDGERRLLIGWMGMPDADYTNPTVENGWQHGMTVPCELKRDSEKLLRVPAPEMEALRGERIAPEQAQIFDLEAQTAPRGRLVIRGAAVLEWDEGTLSLTLVQGGSGRTVRYAEPGTVRSLRVLADASSLEIFVNGGEQVLTTRYYPAPHACGVQSEGVQAELWAMGALQIQ